MKGKLEITKRFIQTEGTDIFEPVEEDEERVINIVIDEKMTKADVANMILDAVRKYCREHEEFNQYDI